MNRAYSLLTVRSVDDEQRIIYGTATTPTPDRMKDVINPLGVRYKNPLPLLHQHDSKNPVGKVWFKKPTKAGVDFEARIPKVTEPGPLKDRVDTAWLEVKYDLVRATSVGFRELQSEPLESGGILYDQSEVLELSLVTVPANSECTITTIKSIDTELLAASGRKQSDDPTSAGASVTNRNPVVKAQEAKHAMKKTYAEQIASFEATRQAKAARMDEIMSASADKGETLDAEQSAEYDGLETEIKSVDEHLTRLRAAEKRDVATAKEVVGKSPDDASDSRGAPTRVQVLRSNKPKGVGFVQLLSARFMAKEDGGHPADIAAARGWGDDVVNVLRVPKHILQKTAIAPANTTDSTWAGPLVTYQNLQEEFIELQAAKSLITRLPGLRRVPFNIKVPRETATTTGYWVGQGSPKPVSKGALDTVTLDFNKVAGITYQTQELLRFSRPNSEQLMISSLTKALTYLVDRDFLDPAKAVSTGVSPASITNGSTSITATGTTADAFRANLASVLALYSQANYTLDGLVIIMTQTQGMRLGLLRNDFGAKEFPDVNKDGGSIEGFPVVTSENIVANGGSPADGAIIVFANTNDILLADDGGVEIDVSTEASIQADSAPDSPATASTVLVSLWQNNLIGIRVERYVSWTKARTDSVVYIAGANYG